MPDQRCWLYFTLRFPLEGKFIFPGLCTEPSFTVQSDTIKTKLLEIGMLTLDLFSFSGLGYVVGQGLATVFGEWQYSMRGTPVLGTIAVLLILFVLVDPPRGEAEGQEHLEASSYSEDIKHLIMNKSFIFSTLGFTCVAFCTGALSWWGPKFLETSILAMEVPEIERGVNIAR